MAKKAARELLRKSDTSFGSAHYDHTNLPESEEQRTGFIIHFSLEEGLKLQLSLQQALWELNRLDRRSPRSLDQSVSLTVFPRAKRVMVNMGRLKHRPKRKTAESELA